MYVLPSDYEYGQYKENVYKILNIHFLSIFKKENIQTNIFFLSLKGKLLLLVKFENGV